MKKYENVLGYASVFLISIFLVYLLAQTIEAHPELIKNLPATR